jgi:Fic family protein
VGSEMNILKGKLNKKQMTKFAGVEIQEVDKSLNRLKNLGFLRYKKIKGQYQFILYPEPVRELEITNKINAGH